MTEWLLCLAGWCALALGMDRHHEDALGRTGAAPTLQRLRVAGWTLLAMALAHAAGQPAPAVPMGLVSWGVALSWAALSATALTTWRPQWLSVIGMAALLAGLLTGAVGWWRHTGVAGPGPG